MTPATVQPIVVGGSQTTLTIEGLDANVEYTVSVRATNLRGQGEQGESETIPASFDLGSVGAEVILVSTAAGPCAGDVATPPPPDTTDGGTTTPGTDPDSSTTSSSGSEAGSTDGGTVTRTPTAPRPEPPTEAEDDTADDSATEAPATGGEDAAQTPEAAAPEPEPVTSAPPAAPASRSTAWIWWTLGGLLALVGGAATVPAVRGRMSGGGQG